MKNERPFGVTLLAVLVLSLSVLSLLRFGSAISQWDILAEFAPHPGPLFIMLTGLLWTLIGFPLFLGLWLGYSLALRAALPSSAIYASYYWLDRLSYQFRLEPNNWLFALGATIIVLVFTVIIVTHPSTKMFFDVSIGNDQQLFDTFEE